MPLPELSRRGTRCPERPAAIVEGKIWRTSSFPVVSGEYLGVLPQQPNNSNLFKIEMSLQNIQDPLLWRVSMYTMYAQYTSTWYSRIKARSTGDTPNEYPACCASTVPFLRNSETTAEMSCLSKAGFLATKLTRLCPWY